MLRLDPYRPTSTPSSIGVPPGHSRRTALRLGGAAALAAVATLGGGRRAHAAPPAVVRQPPAPPGPRSGGYARIVGML
ncbi:hypothetical protein [Sinomonas mesophila]|uniref:hypothetical protein n=1 Tax=Sinomonas mesophila TaxID=1531955 RepID=UPI0009876016|nr:hypothetical protein [Sinomonas mesophila]